MADWKLVDEVGGEDALYALLADFYDRLFEDLIIGFLFHPHDKEELIAHQFNYVTAHVGDRSGFYTGRNLRAAHAHLPILSGMFDRRHQILKDVLRDHGVPAHVEEAWITLDLALRDFIIDRGSEERDRRLKPASPEES